MFAGVEIGNIAERAIEGLQPIGRRSIDHLGHGVVPEVLLHRGAGRAVGMRILDDTVAGMAAADPGGLHGAAGGEVGRAQADALHARAGGGDLRPKQREMGAGEYKLVKPRAAAQME